MNNSKQDVLDSLRRLGVIAVIRHDSSEGLLDAVAALSAGGIRAIEITMTTPGAMDLIRRIAAEFASNDVLLGAGTVTDVEQARTAIDAGARYIVGPTFNADVVTHCNREQVVVIPGAFTPTEIQTAWRAGADIVKVFPANIGGPAYFRDLAGPLPGMRLMPTGGVDLETAPRFFAAGAFVVGVGGAVVGSKLIRDGKFDDIRSNAERFVSTIAARENRSTELASA
jgi:2-dehydro-3-deoxyphosphogluconate aldolase/(4S)-4-hydroxy-2-oxoglutarate aldolase